MASPSGPVLAGWAALPSTFRQSGPTSGHQLEPQLGVKPPFVGGQPVPGFSAMLRLGPNRFLGMPDNGYGKQQAGDFVLGAYTVAIDWKARHGRPGPIQVEGFMPLSDPHGWLRNGRGYEQVIVADMAYYPGSRTPVDPAIARGRWLTGFDFDVESIARAPDGTLWIGEEFGPFLLHVNARGELVGEPVPHPFLLSPDNPQVQAGHATATLPASRGFEAIAFGADSRMLYVATEAAPSVPSLRIVPDDERVIQIFEFDRVRQAYTDRVLRYRKDGPARDNAIVIGDMAHLGGTTFAVIERDSRFGKDARVKRIYTFDLSVVDADGVLRKTLLADLLHIADPRRISGTTFAMPFDSIESLLVLDPRTLLVGIDTNYPSEDARVPGRPDDTEVVKLRFDRPLVPKASSIGPH